MATAGTGGAHGAADRPMSAEEKKVIDALYDSRYKLFDHTSLFSPEVCQFRSD